MCNVMYFYVAFLCTFILPYTAVKPDVGQVKDYPPFAHLLTERACPSIGATQGHMPVLTSNDQNKPYGQALRGLAGF